jgi:antirestriction protein ArdC
MRRLNSLENAMQKRSRAKRKSQSIPALVNRAVLNAIRRCHPSLPWWRAEEPLIRPQSVTGHTFRGINTLQLWCVGVDRGFSSPIWGTAEQWIRQGKHLTPSETPTTAVTYVMRPGLPHERTLTSRVLIARPLLVFNAKQVGPPISLTSQHGANSISLQRLIESSALCMGSDVTRAAASDDSDEDLARNLLRALVKWSGSPDRLARKTWSGGSGARAIKEDLICELGSAYLSADLHLAAHRRVTPKALSGWLQLLHSNARAVFSIAAEAERAPSYVLRALRKHAP